MAGKNRLDRASGAADEFMEMFSKVADAEAALKLLRRLQADIADRERLLEAEVARKADQREIRLKAAAGEAALRLLLEGEEDEREWMRERLAPLLREGDRREVLGDTAWLSVRWAQRKASEAAREEARAARQKRPSPADNNLPGTSLEDDGNAGAGASSTAIAPPPADGERSIGAAADGDGTNGADDPAIHVHVAAVSFAEKPDDKVRASMKSVGLVWSGTEQRWRPKAAGTTVITAVQAAAIRAAGGAIAAA